MPAIEIRPAIEADLPALVALDHSYTSDYVWQIDLQTNENQIGVAFREVRLPRSNRVDYPRQPKQMLRDWKQRAGLFVACLDQTPVGYISLSQHIAPQTLWVTDLVVQPSLRRRGIASALLLSVQDWAGAHRDTDKLVLEIQPKNYGALQLGKKLGFDFSGYIDHFYANRDIAILLAKWVR